MYNEEIKNLFESRGVRLTAQRLLVYRYLLENRIHPAVEDIYSFVKQENPAFSKTTVYNTLHSLVEHGLVQELSIDPIKTRYDVNILFHGHFLCSSCGKVSDVTTSASDFLELKGYAVTKEDINLYGLCPTCNQKHSG